MTHAYPSKDMHLDSSWIIKNHLRYFKIMLLEIAIYTWRIFCAASYWTYIYSIHINMDPVDYWLMAREYSIWNAAIAALQFWTADLEAHVLSSAIEQVYNAFFYSTSTHMLHQQSDEVLFSCFMTTLNTTYESKLALEGYDSGSKNFNIPTQLRRTSKIHHISSVKNASFDPSPVTPCSTGTKESHCRPVHRCFTFSSSKEDDDDTPTEEIPSPNSTLPVQYYRDAFQLPPSKCTLNAYITLEAEEELEEDFPTVQLNDEHWDMEEIPTDLYVFTNIPYHMDCANTCVHILITRHHHIMTHWI